MLSENRMITTTQIKGAPELVVEILSPSTSKRDEGLKKELYEQGACRNTGLSTRTKRPFADSYLLTAPTANQKNARTVLHWWATERNCRPHARLVIAQQAAKLNYLLNRKWQISPSRITYSLPSMRILPAARISFSLLYCSKSESEYVSQRMKPFSKSVWITPAA